MWLVNPQDVCDDGQYRSEAEVKPDGPLTTGRVFIAMSELHKLPHASRAIQDVFPHSGWSNGSMGVV